VGVVSLEAVTGLEQHLVDLVELGGPAADANPGGEEVEAEVGKGGGGEVDVGVVVRLPEDGQKQ
jgi:hypothetical protein